MKFIFLSGLLLTLNVAGATPVSKEMFNEGATELQPTTFGINSKPTIDQRLTLRSRFARFDQRNLLHTALNLLTNNDLPKFIKKTLVKRSLKNPESPFSS